MVVSSSPDTPAVTKTLFHVPTRTTACNTDNSTSDDDSCCGGNLDTEAGQSKSVLESMLDGEKVPVEEVVQCIHNLLAIACEDPEMRKQVLLRLMPSENAVEASNSVPAPPVVGDGVPMLNYNPHAFARSKRDGTRLQPNAERQSGAKAR
jgi:hypothetical protein